MPLNPFANRQTNYGWIWEYRRLFSVFTLILKVVWLQIGKLQLNSTSICFFTYVFNSEEDIMKRMGLNGQSFGQTYDAEVSEMTRQLLGFVKSIRNLQQYAARGETAVAAVSLGIGLAPAPTEPVGTGVTQGTLGVSGTAVMPRATGVVEADRTAGVTGTALVINIQKSDNGFPKLPVEVKGELTKKQWEHLLRQYLSEHYSKRGPVYDYITIKLQIGLASGRLGRQVPYEQVEKDTAKFVASEYRPENIIIKDPRNMRKEDIARLLRHLYERQTVEGIDKAFRFKIILGKEKHEETARYREPSIPFTQRTTRGLTDVGQTSRTSQVDPILNPENRSATAQAIDALSTTVAAPTVTNVSGTAIDPPVRITRSRSAAGAVRMKETAGLATRSGKK